MNKIVLVIFIGILGCNPKKESENIDQSESNSSLLVEPKENINRKRGNYSYEPIKALDYGRVRLDINDTSQYYLLKGECAITEWPDTIWLKQYRESMPEDSWNEIISDNQYYQSLAEDTLDLNGIRLFYQMSWRKRYLKFQKLDSSYYILDKTKMKDSWGIILFNGQDDPVIWSGSFIGLSIRHIYNR